MLHHTGLLSRCIAHARWVCFAVLTATALHPAILAGQDLPPGLDALVARVESGDRAARDALGALTGPLLAYTAEHRVGGEFAHATARAALAMAAPLSPPEHAVSGDERRWRTGAVRTLRQALAVDSGDVWAAERLEAITPYPYVWLDAEKEFQHLRALAARVDTLPAGLAVAWCELALEFDRVEAAETAFARLPASVSLAKRGHLRAQIAFQQGRDETGRDAYYAGAAAIRDSADAAWFSRDLEWIARPEELTEWAALPFGAGRAEWLQRFWTRRDLLDAQLPGTRLPEQFHRWRLALRRYRWDLDGGTAVGLQTGNAMGIEYSYGDVRFPEDPASDLADANRLVPTSRVLDDRGRLVLRLGVPARSEALPGVSALTEENLLWLTPEGPLIVGFSRPAVKAAGDAVILYRLGMLARNRPTGDLTTLCNLDGRLCGVAAGLDITVQVPGRGTEPPPAWARDRANSLRLDYSRMRDLAEHTEGNPEAFRDSLHAVLQVYGIPGGGVLVVTAFPATKLLSRENQTNSTWFTGKTRVIVGDSLQGKIVGTLDTTRTWHSSAPLSAGVFLNAWYRLPAPVGTWSVAVVVGDTARRVGTGLRFRDVPVVPLHSTELTLGDPILGRAGSGLTWTWEGTAVPLNPANAWRKDESGILTYLVDGMVPGRSYETQLELWDAKGNPERPKNTIAFTTKPAGTRDLVQRELSFQELSPGDYRLVLRVKDMTTGRIVTRERRLAIRR
jgi:hypothetical protein